MSHSLHSKIITAVLLLTTFSSTINAQETGPKNRNIELALQTGFGDFYSVGLSDETWNNYTPGFVVPDDSSQQNGYQMYSGTLFSVTSYVLGSVHVSYRNAMLDAKKIRSSFGLTFGSGVGYRTEQSWTKSETFTIDTLTSSQTGQQYAVDSTHQRTVGRSYEANDFMIGLSHFFQTNPARRFALHLGITASYGFSVNAQLSTYQYDWSSVSANVGLSSPTENDYQRTELSNAPKSHSLTLQIPVELSFRPWKNGKALQGFSIAIAYRPTLKNFVIAGEKATSINSWYGFTMRYTI